VNSAKEKRVLGSYAGKSGQERQAVRREQLVEAGLEVFGTTGYAGSSVKAICDQAGLTERYFYESFKSRDGLLFAVYESVATEVIAEAFAASERAEPTVEDRTRAGIGAFFTLLTNDRRKARVLSFEVVGVNDQLERRRRETIHTFAEYLAQTGLEMYEGDGPPSMDPMLTALSMVGATNELLIEWVLGNIDSPIETVIEHCTQMIVSLTRVGFGEAPWSES
jgi:AcrR family transcriptional regulator